MSFDEGSFLPPPPVYCSGERYRQCSPESCPGLTAQCTERCVVVTCSDPHDGDSQDVCGDIICDDQGCTDPTDCHGIYDFLQCCDNYHDDICGPKSHTLDDPSTVSAFNGGGWDPAFDTLLQQSFQHSHEHPPVDYYNGIATSPSMSTPGTVTSMAVSSSRSSSPSASSTRQSHRHSYIHSNVHQPNHDQQYHIAMQLDGSLAFEPSSQKSHDLSPVQSQSHFAVGRAEVLGQHSCMWASCHAVFGSLQDLVAHVNVQHLQTVSTLLTANNQFDAPQDPPPTHHQPAPSPAGQVFPSCHWGDCHVYPTVENVPGSSDRPLDAALGVLAAHLWEYHLGLPTPPPQFNFPEVQTPTGEVEIVNAGPPPVPASLAAAEMSGVADILSSSQPPLDSVHNRIPTPTQDQDKAPDPSHDCTTTDHPCEWLDCQERFASCEALMTHVAVEHVGGGKNHYGCFWNGCGRNGENGFKSKQKICRHLQSHTGHRPHQCEICHQCFSEVATLQQHMRRHTQEKPYECDYSGCGKRFAIMGALTIHKRMHNGDKPFKCTQCDKAFSESSNLSKHLRTHTGARPYVCPEPGCGKCFGRGDQLTRHMNVHSGGGKVKKRTAVATTKVA